MKAKALLLAILLTIAVKGHSQISRDKFYFGGNLGLSFGPTTFIEVSPLLGYKVTDRFSVGTGITYIYYSTTIYFTNSDKLTYSTNIYGSRLFARYLITESIFAHTEYEYLNRGFLDGNTVQEKRVDVNSVFVGGGYRQMLGERSSATIMLLYNLNETPYTPYTNPVLRIGFNFGL